MRKARFTDYQIMDAVKRLKAGSGVADICRELDLVHGGRLNDGVQLRMGVPVVLA